MAETSTTTLTGLVKTAYSKAVEFAFQPQLFGKRFPKRALQGTEGNLLGIRGQSIGIALAVFQRILA